MATSLEEVDVLREKYIVTVSDRQQKQTVALADSAALREEIQSSEHRIAVASERARLSRKEWINAAKVEHAAEDAYEAALIDHEPPAIPPEDEEPPVNNPPAPETLPTADINDQSDFETSSGGETPPSNPAET